MLPNDKEEWEKRYRSDAWVKENAYDELLQAIAYAQEIGGDKFGGQYAPQEGRKQSFSEPPTRAHRGFEREDGEHMYYVPTIRRVAITLRPEDPIPDGEEARRRLVALGAKRGLRPYANRVYRTARSIYMEMV